MSTLSDSIQHALFPQTPPYPYLQEHADFWVDATKKVCDAAIRELEEENRINPDGPLKVVGSCPVRSIREVRADGTDVYLGDICVDRCASEELDDDNADKENSLVDANMAKETGDPSIIWTIGGTSKNTKASLCHTDLGHCRLSCCQSPPPRNHERSNGSTPERLGYSKMQCAHHPSLCYARK